MWSQLLIETDLNYLQYPKLHKFDLLSSFTHNTIFKLKTYSGYDRI